MSTLVLSYMSKIDSNALEKAEFPRDIQDLEPDDLEIVQKFLIEDMKKLLNLDLISKEMDRITRN